VNRGYIRVWRKIEDGGIMGNADVCQLFLHLLLKAASKPRRQIIGASLVSLEAGQAVVGRKQLAAELGSSEARVRAALAFLEQAGVIRRRATNKYTVVSLVNWARYQHCRSGDEPAAGRPDATNKKAEENKEFLELRACYDRLGRAEGPLAGWREYQQARAAPTWPGLEQVRLAVEGLAALDRDWQRGFAPGLARFLREQQWRKKPSGQAGGGCAPGQARGSGSPRSGVDAATAGTMNAIARVLARRQKGAGHGTA
jgi:hypothetical protein